MDDASSFIEELIRTTARAANLPSHQLARELLAAYQPRDAAEAMLAAQVIVDEAILMDHVEHTTKPGLSVEELLRRTAAVVKLEKKIRAAQRKLERKSEPTATAGPVRLSERLKTHFVDGGGSIH